MSRRSSGRSTLDTTSSVAASVTVAIDNLVTAADQCFFGLLANTFVAIAEGTGQSSHDFGATAAAVFANLLRDFGSGGTSDTLIGIVQSVHESRHNFRIADAIAFAEFLDRFAAIFRIAAGLRCIDQLGDFARISIAAGLVTALSRSSAVGSTGSRRSAISCSRTTSSRSSTNSRSTRRGSGTFPGSGSTGSRGTGSRGTGSRSGTFSGSRSTGSRSSTFPGSGCTAGFRCTSFIAARRFDVRVLALIHIHLGFAGPGNGWLAT